MVPPGSMCKYDLSLRSYPLNQSRVARHERMMAAKACSIMDSKLLCKLATTRKVNFSCFDSWTHFVIFVYFSFSCCGFVCSWYKSVQSPNSNFSSSSFPFYLFIFLYFRSLLYFYFFVFSSFFATMEWWDLVLECISSCTWKHK